MTVIICGSIMLSIILYKSWMSGFEAGRAFVAEVFIDTLQEVKKAYKVEGEDTKSVLYSSSEDAEIIINLCINYSLVFIITLILLIVVLRLIYNKEYF